MKGEGKSKGPKKEEVILLEDLLPEEDPKGGRAGNRGKTTFGDRSLFSEIEGSEAGSEDEQEPSHQE